MENRVKACMNILRLSVLNKVELNNAYKKYSKIYHPDNLKTGNKNMFIIIKDAYDYLKSHLVERIVVKFSAKDLILNNCEYKFKDTIHFKPTISNINNFFKPLRYDINCIKYNFVFKFMDKDGYKVYKKDNKYIFEIPFDITLDDIRNKMVHITILDKEYISKIPLCGKLENNINFDVDKQIKIKYNIVV